MGLLECGNVFLNALSALKNEKGCVPIDYTTGGTTFHFCCFTKMNIANLRYWPV